MMEDRMVFINNQVVISGWHLLLLISYLDTCYITQSFCCMLSKFGLKLETTDCHRIITVYTADEVLRFQTLQTLDEVVKDADTRCLLLTGRKAISC